jgi:hypothetical protein
LSNLHAATTCSSIAAKQQVRIGTPAHILAAQGRTATEACAQNCQIAGLEAGDAKLIVPAPTHLPVVSEPDEVASWHAEIFEQITAARAASARIQVCKLGL